MGRKTSVDIIGCDETLWFYNETLGWFPTCLLAVKPSTCVLLTEERRKILQGSAIMKSANQGPRQNHGFFRVI